MNYQSTIALEDLPQREPTRIAIGETDVLLIRDGEQVQAFQATCPHAGAPLEEGAICDDKLICPWHKAVFDITAGTLHEPLALSDLQQYPVRVEQGMILVSPQALARADAVESDVDTPVMVILGTGAAGSAAAWTLRHEGYQGKIVLVERERQAPYDRTALTKFVPSGKMAIDEVPVILDDDFMQQVERVNADVERLDSKAQQLHLADGSSLHYDKLLIATGGTPQRPDVPGNTLENVHVLRSIEQADGLLKQVDAHHKLTIIGNSFIGMELASALRSRKVEVQVIAPQPLPFEKQFGKEVATHFRRLHEKNGVSFIEGEIEQLEGEEKVSGVRLTDGQLIATQVVLFATGVVPATQFIHDLPLEEDGSLRTDGYLSAATNLWVAGDIATYPVSGGHQRIEHYRVAQQQGRVAALNMLNHDELFDRVPFFWTAHYGTRYEYLGHASEWDEYRLIGSLEEQVFIALYGQKGQLVAATSCGLYTLTAELLYKMQKPMSMTDAVKMAARARLGA